MNKDEALKLALEALENGMKFVWTDPEREAGFVAIDALKEALAQPAQEPVAWMVYTQDGQSVYVTDNSTDIQESQRALPLYTTPPAAQPVQTKQPDFQNIASKLAKLAQHAKGCLRHQQLATGCGYWSCSCGLDSLVLDGELLQPPLPVQEPTDKQIDDAVAAWLNPSGKSWEERMRAAIKAAINIGGAKA